MDNIHLLTTRPHLRTLLHWRDLFFELRDGRHLPVTSQGPCHLARNPCKPFDIKGYRFFLDCKQLQLRGGFPPIDLNASCNLADIRLVHSFKPQLPSVAQWMD
ncbi:hypothetical protein DKY63_13055 [Pseudomonas putida]|uniref:Uncharacterized protein n=1 Tax=Pseudomonas putida TaxID=303 RepID=A0A2Z4RI62_PSEPU|nr:hypothetical protein DKY63_13055 [Pseudomonas putida]